MATNIKDYPELPEGYYWVRDNQLNDYYVVEFVEIRKKGWWIFSESIDWYGVRAGGDFETALRNQAQVMAKRVVENLP